jgi:hypothetical protein
MEASMAAYGNLMAGEWASSADTGPEAESLEQGGAAVEFDTAVKTAGTAV